MIEVNSAPRVPRPAWNKGKLTGPSSASASLMWHPTATPRTGPMSDRGRPAGPFALS